MPRVPGHSLLPGLLVLPDCTECLTITRQSEFQPRAGHGLCSCSAVSYHTASEAARRRWHTWHKAEVRIDDGKRTK